MSEAGDRSFANAVRDDIERAISEHTKILIARTTEREAGFIQGLDAALMLINERIRIITADHRPYSRN